MAAARSALACTGAGPLAPARRAAAAPLPPLAAPQPGRRQPARGPLAVAASAPRARSEADLYRQEVAVSAPTPAPPPSAAQAGGPLAGQPWYVTAPLALLGVVAAARAARAIKKGM